MNKAEKLFLMFFIVLANEIPESGVRFAVAFLFLVFVGVAFVFASYYEEVE